MTSHIKAKKAEIAKTILMPGDPLRAQAIAHRFLANVKKVNSVRNMFMYTGTYNGRPVSICGSGMGQPSIGIYSYELFKFFDVANIIRIGTAGSYRKDLNLYDVALVNESYSDSKAFNKIVGGVNSHVMQPSLALNARIRMAARKRGVKIYEVRAHSSDVFYNPQPLAATIKRTQADCVEMESGALFATARLLQKDAACLLTISDNLVTRESTTLEERQSKFTDMVKIALELA